MNLYIYFLNFPASAFLTFSTLIESGTRANFALQVNYYECDLQSQLPVWPFRLLSDI